MKNQTLKTTTQGIQGGNFKSEKTGLSLISVYNDDSINSVFDIKVDGYQGQGKDYKQREKALITIYFDDKEYWTGTAEELKKVLPKKS